MKSEKSRTREHLDSLQSERSGMGRWLENGLRRFQILMHLALLAPLYALASATIGMALIPSVLMFQWSREFASKLPAFWQAWALGATVTAGFFVFGFALIAVIPVMNWGLRARLSEWRGPYYSLPAVRWYIHNGLTYLVRYTILEFLTPTPFNLFFFRQMGMKIGKGTIINSSCISDPSLIEIGHKVTIGGSVTIVGHYGQGGFLVLAPVKIGDFATIGLRAVIMGGVEIGANAKILPNSVVLPKTKIPPNETWGGVPAARLNEYEKKNAA